MKRGKGNDDDLIAWGRAWLADAPRDEVKAAFKKLTSEQVWGLEFYRRMGTIKAHVEKLIADADAKKAVKAR